MLIPSQNFPMAKPRAPQLIVREMRLTDLAAVYALGERLFTADRWPTLYRTWDEYEPVALFNSDGDYCLVAERAGSLVGFALGAVIEKRKGPWRYGYLMWIGVEPRYGRSGVAGRLVERLTELFIRAGVRIMIVDTDADNREALQFFRKQGFGNDDPHVYLSKNLTRHPEYNRLRTRNKGNRGPDGATEPE